MISKNRSKLIDRVTCIICLISDNLLRKFRAQVEKKVNYLLERLEEVNIMVRELAYIYFIEQTIGYKTGKQGAEKFFNLFILPNFKEEKQTNH